MVHPYEGFAFPCKVEEWSCKFGVILDEASVEVTESEEFLDEASVEVTESEEFLDVFYSFGSQPVFDGFEFNWVHL
jgi:hypothetical protein